MSSNLLSKVEGYFPNEIFLEEDDEFYSIHLRSDWKSDDHTLS